MTHNERTGPAPNLESIEQDARRRAPEEDEGVNYDEELDQKRVLDDVMLEDGNDERLPSERLEHRDDPDDDGRAPGVDEQRQDKRRQQYDDGADLVSELD